MLKRAVLIKRAKRRWVWTELNGLKNVTCQQGFIIRQVLFGKRQISQKCVKKCKLPVTDKWYHPRQAYFFCSRFITPVKHYLLNIDVVVIIICRNMLTWRSRTTLRRSTTRGIRSGGWGLSWWDSGSSVTSRLTGSRLRHLWLLWEQRL